MKTKSLCPICYKEIDADIYVDGKVIMEKECLEHGPFSGVVENDSRWWNLCRAANAPEFYGGYLVDITNKCNIKCKYCYHDNNNQIIPFEMVMSDIYDNINLGPIFLTGGEPTLNP
jgi:uncharacterized radical SAM superfamily Fe-S cluster-containing enzyme